MSADSIAQALREMIIDENKIVTYKTLSRACTIHVNLAKKSLEDFLNSEEGLNASYLLSGLVNGDTSNSQGNEYYVAVVPNSKLEEVKAKFLRLDSCHVYSIQKTHIKDSSVLFSANIDQTSLLSGKERPKPVIRNTSLCNNRRPLTTVKKVTTVPQKKESTPASTAPDTNTSSESGAQNAKLQNKPTENAVETVKSQNKSNHTKATTNGKGPKPNGIMAAFMKGQSNSNNKKKTSPATNSEKPKIEEKTDSKLNGVKLTEDKKRKNIKAAEELKVAEKQMWNSSESSSDEEVAPPPKRSKTMNRIKQLPESDSEDDNDKKADTASLQDSEEPIPRTQKSEHRISDDEDEDVIPPTPDENKTIRQYVPVKNTYLDEDGFLVTRKERKLEEVEIKQTPPAQKSKTSPPSTTPNINNRGKSKKSKSAPDDKKNQPSLMSFFTKK